MNDAMDVHGGKGICMGPSNYLARAYQSVPIAITVEGANILTRSMIIYGQGAIRGHPYVLKEIAATKEADLGKALVDFDAAFFGHVAFVISNFARTLWMGFTRAFFTGAPGDAHTRRYYQQLTRLSSAFALMSDAAMFVLGGSLKRRERLSARLGDILSWLYLASTVLKRYEDSGRPADDLPFVRWAMQDALYKIQQAFYGLFENLPSRLVAIVLRHVIFSYGREFEPPRDQLGQAVVATLLAPCAARERVTAGIFIPKNEDEAVGTLEAALRAVIAAEAVETKIRAGVKAGTLTSRRADELAAQAVANKLISGDEAAVLTRAQALRRKVIMVDDFPRDLGKSEIFQTTQAVTFEALQRRQS
jgi:acyl-CoA dehydrogenase